MALTSVCAPLRSEPDNTTIFAPSLALVGATLLTWSLIALTMIDVDHQLLPDDITLPLLWLGLVLNTMGTFVSLQDAVLGAIFGYLILWSVYWIFKLLTGKEGMGYGDFKLLAMLDEYISAVGSRVACLDDATIPCSIDRRTSWCRVVSASMRSLRLVDRVKSIGVEIRAHSREVKRCAQERLTHADAFFIVVAGITLEVGVAVGLEGLSSVSETGCEYGTIIK